jgi:hypothetical protein
MSKLVKVAPGYSAVPLYSSTLNSGQTILLTDAQFENLPGFIQQQLMVVSSTPDSAAWNIPEASYTFSLVNSILKQLGTPLTLTWDGTTYQPSKYIADMTRVKVFVGPTDPTTVAGVFLNDNDQWVSEAL